MMQARFSGKRFAQYARLLAHYKSKYSNQTSLNEAFPDSRRVRGELSMLAVPEKALEGVGFVEQGVEFTQTAL